MLHTADAPGGYGGDVPASNATLSLNEADSLLSAWASAQAERVGIRELLIKGRTLAHHGLREARLSADVDVLIEPSRFDQYCEIVKVAGWTELPSTFVTEFFTLHSRTFTHANWPNTLDVHRFFPGFLSSPENVFDRLWERRESLVIARHVCAIPDRPASILILALHSMRSSRKNLRHERELGALRTTPLDPRELADVVALAHATGSVAPLKDLLSAWGASIELDPKVFASIAYRDWAQAVAEARGAPADWHRVLQRAPWRHKPRVLLRALWPSEADLRRTHATLASSRMSRLRIRVQRLGRGFTRARRNPRVGEDRYFGSSSSPARRSTIERS